MQLLNIAHQIEQIAADSFTDAIGALDITSRQAAVLAVIDAFPGCSQTGVVNATGVDRSTAADICRRLKRKDWITRRRTRKDARTYELQLTNEGARVLRLARVAAAKAEATLCARVDGMAKLRIKPLEQGARKAAAGQETDGQRAAFGAEG